MRFLYQYINPTGAKARAWRNDFIGCRGPPSHSPCLPRPCPEPLLLWIISRAPAEAQSEPASQSARSGCAGDSTKHLQPEQQPWISSRSQPPWTARLWEKKRTVTTGNGRQSRFFWRVGALWKSCICLGRTRYPLLKEISPHGLVVNNIFKGEQITQCATVIEWVLCFCAVF